MVNSAGSVVGEVGADGREWWAQRWVDVLESFGWRRRLERARNYVREGRVLELTFEGAEVSALVQGTAPEPYEVDLSIDPFDDEQWSYVIEELSQRAIFAAKLLAGEMPQNIEEAFTASGLSLFPFSKFDIHSRCNCPDPVNPCKHIGAVYYLLGNQFSQDPFILFQLRGRAKISIIDALRQNRSKAADAGQSAQKPKQVGVKTAVTLDLSFWSYDEQLDPSLVVIAPPPTSETVIDVLGPMPTEAFTQAGAVASSKISDGQKLLEYLKDVYQRTGQQAMMMAMLSRDSD
ncbi:MAG: metal-binding protein [Thermosynechococcaceae cyanobacterium]